jgi:tetratricopeptide (TPR) repeat protein
MSRQELADAVNTYLTSKPDDRYRREATLDANHIGKLERGVHRWPNDIRREAFRHVLRASDDREVGFHIVRGPEPQTTVDENAALDRYLPPSPAAVTRKACRQSPLTFRQVGVDDLATGDVDPSLVPHWSGMLRVLASAHDAFGPRYLHEVVRGELSIIRRHRIAAQPEVSVGLLNVETRWAEFASWTADNLGDFDAARNWLEIALALAQQANNRPMVAYVLMRQAQQALDRRDRTQARILAEQAREQAPLSLRDRALCAIRYAQALALTGQAHVSLTAIDEAYALVSKADEADTDMDPYTIGRHCTRTYVAAHEGFCKLALGRHDEAVALLEAVLMDWPQSYRQDEAVARSWLAHAYAEAGRLAEAGLEGTRALALTIQTGSARAQRDLGRLEARLAVDHKLPEAERFAAAYRMIVGQTGGL